MEISKNRRLLTIVGLLVVTGALRLLSNAEVGLTNDALAAAKTGAVSVACIDPVPTAFAPDVALAITWSTPTAASGPIPSATATLSGPVNGETDPTVVATLNGTGAPAGFVVLTSTTPVIKLAGCQCQTSCQSMIVAAHGSADANAALDVALSNIIDDDTGYTSTDQVDNVAAASATTLCGPSGQITTTLPTDAGDGTTDGEILAAGDESGCGSDLHSVIDVTNHNTADVVTLTFTLTPE